MKAFVTQCKVGDLIAEGEGNGKKISKKRAAEKMLEELGKLPPLVNINTMAHLKRKRVATKKKTRNLIKVNMDSTADYSEDINPISRLIQIQQANREKEPVYTVSSSVSLLFFQYSFSILQMFWIVQCFFQICVANLHLSLVNFKVVCLLLLKVSESPLSDLRKVPNKCT